MDARFRSPPRSRSRVELPPARLLYGGGGSEIPATLNCAVAGRRAVYGEGGTRASERGRGELLDDDGGDEDALVGEAMRSERLKRLVTSESSS